VRVQSVPYSHQSHQCWADKCNRCFSNWIICLRYSYASHATGGYNPNRERDNRTIANGAQASLIIAAQNQRYAGLQECR
jgi:hypothetical protein